MRNKIQEAISENPSCISSTLVVELYGFLTWSDSRLHKSAVTGCVNKESQPTVLPEVEIRTQVAG